MANSDSLDKLVKTGDVYSGYLGDGSEWMIYVKHNGEWHCFDLREFEQHRSVHSFDEYISEQKEHET